MNKWENLVFIHNDVLFNYKKEWSPGICDNINETGGHYVKWNKAEKDKYFHWYVDI
jgi:hypothetical protein